MIKLFKNIFNVSTPDFKSLARSGVVIVDVRSNAEFKTGHIKGAINIPVEQVKLMVNELKELNKPVITCCQSGMRSGMAASVLKAAGVQVYNGGAWNSLQQKI